MMTQKDHKPRNLLIQLSGPPGSGKSTLANDLSLSPLLNNITTTTTITISLDSIKSTLLSPPHTLPFPLASSTAYKQSFNLASAHLSSHRNVVLDSCCNYAQTVETGIKVARMKGAEYWYIELVVSKKDIGMLDARLRGRVGLVSQRRCVDEMPAGMEKGDGEARKMFEKWLDPVRPTADLQGGIHTISVDARNTPEDIRDQVLSQMGFPTSSQQPQPQS